MRSLFIQLTIAALLTQSCFFDPYPPEDEDLYDERPALILRLNGFATSAKFRIRFWDGGGAWTYPESYTFYTDGEGNFLGSISLTKGTTSVSYYLMVDEDKSGDWGVGDRAFYRNALAIDSATDTVTDTVTLAGSSAVVAYNTTQTNLIGPGTLICIYFPELEGTWDSTMASSIPEFPVIYDAALLLSDWFPVSTKIFGGGSTSSFLISGNNYKETCIRDDDGDEKHTTGEPVTDTVGVITP